MREAILYRLIQNLKGENVYIPVHEFMGDIYCKELNLGGFVSHECSARLSEINKDNPDLLQVQPKKAKYTNTEYYCYRITPDFTPSLLQDTKLWAFYNDLEVIYTPRPKPATCAHGLPMVVMCPECLKEITN